MTARELVQRRRVLFTLLTALDYRYRLGRESALIVSLRAWLHGVSRGDRSMKSYSRPVR